MEDPQPNGTPEKPERRRWLFEYGIDGDLRFISHHDTMRLFRRALVRADLPVRWTKGFNPHPQIALPLPRPVGVASDAEALIVVTEGVMEAEDALRRLQLQMPEGLHLIRARGLPKDEKMEPTLVRYRVDPPEPPVPDLQTRARALLEAENLYVERKRPKMDTAVRIDVRPYLVDIDLDGDFVEFALRVTPGGTAKPAEIARLLGYQGDAINHRIRRMEIQWR